MLESAADILGLLQLMAAINSPVIPRHCVCLNVCFALLFVPCCKINTFHETFTEVPFYNPIGI